MHSFSLINLAAWNIIWKEQQSRIYHAVCYKYAPRTLEIDVTSYIISMLLTVMILVTVAVLNTTPHNYLKGTDNNMAYATARLSSLATRW
jgi:uncharacterized membrane protein